MSNAVSTHPKWMISAWLPWKNGCLMQWLNKYTLFWNIHKEGNKGRKHRGSFLIRSCILKAMPCKQWLHMKRELAGWTDHSPSPWDSVSRLRVSGLCYRKQERAHNISCHNMEEHRNEQIKERECLLTWKSFTLCVCVCVIIVGGLT